MILRWAMYHDLEQYYPTFCDLIDAQGRELPVHGQLAKATAGIVSGFGADTDVFGNQACPWSNHK